MGDRVFHTWEIHSFPNEGFEMYKHVHKDWRRVRYFPVVTIICTTYKFVLFIPKRFSFLLKTFDTVSFKHRADNCPKSRLPVLITLKSEDFKTNSLDEKSPNDLSNPKTIIYVGNIRLFKSNKLLWIGLIRENSMFYLNN